MTRSAARIACLALAWAAQASAGGSEPGAYCPLPEKGEAPKCMEPARETWTGYFDALDRGSLADADAAQLEQTVAQGAASEHAYLALSSLAYGYYQLARREAGRAQQDAAVTARLARWNTLLEHAYAQSPDDEAYRAAVRRAALDLRVRAPVRLPCRDARGADSDCDSTEAVLRGLDAADERAGFRGALERLLRRFFPGEAA